ncbi:3-methyl-2-oxobutanoate hydroxymethyltransferase [Candidatus Pelagibacter sp.]|nr:3-methyl-2-oxobutanoate hydroxymethyltransferase [Candidatus Pelagibacter sp.]|tara:strand:+ start:528 stop:1307 length:780 start_codon:yes stop_codon:yes gene_type:complete
MISKIKKIINKKNKSKIICLTSYSKNVSEAIDLYADIILVGDSLGSVLYNYSTTRKVTLNQMIEHSKSARLGIKNSLMVVDMPYKTYLNKRIALKNAKKIMKETKCDAVKIEGGSSIIKIVEHLIKNKVPLMGHLGILPQTVKGKFKFKGKKVKERNQIFKDAKLLQDKGVFSIVLECVETTLAKQITKSLEIPTIGIGSSQNCDGQILVIDDLIGLNETKTKFIKKFGRVKNNISQAARNFKKEVLSKKYPTKKYSYN